MKTKLVYKPETSVYFDRKTGEKNENISHWICEDTDEANRFVCMIHGVRTEYAEIIVKAVNEREKLLEVIEELKRECFAWKASSLKSPVDMRDSDPLTQEEYEEYKTGIQENIDFILKADS